MLNVKPLAETVRRGGIGEIVERADEDEGELKGFCVRRAGCVRTGRLHMLRGRGKRLSAGNCSTPWDSCLGGDLELV